jgi:hypothetical protein
MKSKFFCFPMDTKKARKSFVRTAGRIVRLVIGREAVANFSTLTGGSYDARRFRFRSACQKPNRLHSDSMAQIIWWTRAVHPARSDRALKLSAVERGHLPAA